MTAKKKTSKKTRRRTRKQPKALETPSETLEPPPAELEAAEAAPADAAQPDPESTATKEIDKPEDEEATKAATDDFAASVKADALKKREAAATKSGSNGKKKPARPPHRRAQPKPLIRAFPSEMSTDISRRAAEIRHAGGKGPPPPSKEKTPRGRFGAVGDTILCANHKCDRRLLEDGTHVWAFDNPPRHGYEKGSCLCTTCASDFHPTIGRRWASIYERLSKRYGSKEADRVSLGKAYRGGALRTANVSRMG